MVFLMAGVIARCRACFAARTWAWLQLSLQEFRCLSLDFGACFALFLPATFAERQGALLAHVLEGTHVGSFDKTM